MAKKTGKPNDGNKFERYIRDDVENASIRGSRRRALEEEVSTEGLPKPPPRADDWEVEAYRRRLEKRHLVHFSETRALEKKLGITDPKNPPTELAMKVVAFLESKRVAIAPSDIQLENMDLLQALEYLDLLEWVYKKIRATKKRKGVK